jgi:hypothetical protein
VETQVMRSIELHIFTNSTVNSPSTDTILETYNSFLNTFGELNNVTVWCDPNPNIKKSKKYISELKKIFSSVRKTKSLSDGYITSIFESNSEYLFMLEHDWKFNDNILHTLDQIMYYMEKENIWHLRFNKRRTEIKNTDWYLRQCGDKDFYYCLTPSLSNNPHIIHRQTYVEKALPYLEKDQGSFGIEETLNLKRDLTGAIYGHLYYENTITHLDGKAPRDFYTRS